MRPKKLARSPFSRPLKTLTSVVRLCCALFALCLLSVAQHTKTAPAPSAIEQLADDYLAAMMEHDPLMGTYYAIAGARHDRLPDNSLAALAAWESKEDALLERLQAIAVRAFLPMNFPGFGYYFWIDADAWIHDERSLAHFIKNAETKGLGISCSSPAAAGKSFYTQITERDTLQFIDPEFQNCDLFKEFGGVSVGAFCIKADSAIDALWQEVMARNTGSRGIHFFSDTDSCTIAALLSEIAVLPFEHHCHNGFQLENGVFFYRDAPIGIVAMPADTKWQRYDKILEFVNTERSMELLQQITPSNREALLSIKRSTLAYRTFPWRAKPQIAAMLREATLGTSSVFG